MSQHLQPIYDVWGGNAEAMAADIDELGVTVRQWRNRGDIPSRAWPKIIKAAARRDRTIRLEDFLAPEVKSDLPGHEAGSSHEWPLPSANKDGEIIRAVGDDDGAGEGVEPRPFAPTSSRTGNLEEGGEPVPPPAPSIPACSPGPTAMPPEDQAA